MDVSADGGSEVKRRCWSSSKTKDRVCWVFVGSLERGEVHGS